MVVASAASGIWMARRWHNREPEPIADAETPPAVDDKPLKKRETPKSPPLEFETLPTPRESPVETKPPAEEKHVVKPPPPPHVEEKKPIALVEDLPPELEFQIVDAINAERAKADLEPIYLDAKASRACRARAESLARNPSSLRGQETEFAAEPLSAIKTWLAEPEHRNLILDARLRTFGAGFARNVEGQWYSAFDWKSGIVVEPKLDAKTVEGVIVYPAHRQTRVPLWFPGHETPDPLPQAKDKLAGFPITITFPRDLRVDSVTARLEKSNQRDVPVWLSSPDKPANPKYADAQQNTICLIPKQPLEPSVRYVVRVTAKVNDEPRELVWAFTTMSEGEIHHEMAGRLLRTLNAQRRRAGLPAVALDAERSKACRAHARYLSANAPANPKLNWNEEKRELPGYSEAGAALARTASIQGGGGPVEAVTGLVDSFISRSQLLDPRLRKLGLGYTPSAHGGWIWVMDFRRGSGPEKAIEELLYPAPDQQDVPLTYPADEVPSPIPAENKGKAAGYAITAEFLAPVQMTDVTAKLVDDQGETVSAWLSTPQKPAIASYPQRSICLLPRAPLKPGTRYAVTFAATVNEKPWRRTWHFTTTKKPERFADDLAEKLLARVNAARKAAGLPLVRLDAELSRGCQLHARYLSVNVDRPAARGLAVHREDLSLPAATEQGARAARASVIAVVLDPQTCVDGWMATLYHRMPILTPNLERIGFGHARMGERKWACVLDTGNGRKTRP
jgi:uncharacterized protein YkwD